MGAVPETHSQYIVIKSKAPIKYNGYEEPYEARLRFIKPLKWDTNTYLEVAENMFNRYVTWLESIKLDATHEFDYSKLDSLTSSLFPVLASPTKWKRNSKSDISCNDADKIYVICLCMMSSVYIDDTLDKHRDTPKYAKYALETSDLVYKIMSQRFEDLSRLQAYVKENQLIHLGIKYDIMLATQQKMAEELRDVHNINTLDYQDFLIAYKVSYQYLTWFGDNGETQARNLRTYDNNRIHSAGTAVWIELLLMLAKMKVPLVIRQDKYWQRAYVLAAIITALANDFVSFEKESKEAHPDNIICVHVANGFDLATAIEKSVEYFNDYIQELNKILHYIDSGEHHVPTDLDELVTVGYRNTYRESIKLFISMPSNALQAMLCCKRYAELYHFE